jgi:hypothetical protein
LDIQEFIWVDNVIFSGDLYYTGEGYPAADLPLNATLVHCLGLY